jgi:hypothetical protein
VRAVLTLSPDVDSAVAFIAAASEATIRRSVEAYRRGRTAAWRQFFHDLAYDVSAGHVTREVGHHSARQLATGCPSRRSCSTGSLRLSAT